MQKYLALPVLALALCGCVSTANIPLETHHGTSLAEGKSISEVRRGTPDFAAMTAGKAAFAMVGAFAMISAGNEIIRENEVADPANRISENLSLAMAERYSMNRAAPGAEIASSESVDKLAEQFTDTNILLDVRTINWSFGYFPTDWDNYRVMYSAKLRLIDTQRKTAIAEGFCSYMPDKTADAPSKAELLANKAERLKLELDKAADHCIETFRTETLNL